MATETQPQKPLEDVMKNLKIDPSSDAGFPPTVALKDGSPSDATSCISSSGDTTSSTKERDADRESLMAEQGVYYPPGGYYGYYYSGYDASFGEWDDQNYVSRGDGLEIQYPAFQADNGSIFYYVPGFHPGYSPYGTYAPGAMVGVDGQYLGQQPYLPSPMFSQPVGSPGFFPSPVPYGSEVAPAYLWDPSIYGDGAIGSGFVGPTVTGPKPNYTTPSHTLPPKPAPPTKSSTPETKGSLPALNVVSPNSVLHNPSLKPANKVSQHGFQAPTVLTKGYFPISKFPAYSNHGKSELLYPSIPVGIKANERGWGGSEKLKPKGKANGISDMDLLNEQNRGPRTNGAKSNWVTEVDRVGSPGARDNDSDNSSAPLIKRDLYNLPDFPTKYDHALFFVIKSYSEDDVHKSIKYNVWASTQNGNVKLNSAHQDAQERMREKGSKCPVFLFFSVNASGQFCGVAEMMGHVDFSKSMDFWQQDKWNGFFSVKWHIIKDVPNPQFRHVILENNENKPVTNSRDTQEVKFPQGIEMLNIFKNFSAKTSILDDFKFYEDRQKAMQDKRIKAPVPPSELLKHKVDEGQQLNKAGDLQAAVAGYQMAELASSKKNKEEVKEAK